MNKIEKIKTNSLYGMYASNTIKKEKEINFVNGFKNIKVKSICRELGISDSNISAGKGSIENYKKIRKEIEKRYAKLFYDFVR